uniref:Uncharacterized protein n=1 Tax=Pelagomonas calceolata TaxID=35677 RepID=A0A7S4EDU8_9STRA
MAAAAAAVRQAAAMRPAAMHPTAAMRPPAPMQPIALATRRCILAAPLVTLPRRANALYDTKTVDAAKATYDVADATKCKAYLPLLDASGKTLDELAANWDRIATDGDSVRRYLGTVGVTSPLFKIRGGLRGVLKANDLPDAFDAVAFAEASEQFLAELQDAEGDAYGAQFADYSTSVGSGGQSPSATMLGKARKDVERAQRSYAELLKLLAPLR